MGVGKKLDKLIALLEYIIEMNEAEEVEEKTSKRKIVHVNNPDYITGHSMPF